MKINTLKKILCVVLCAIMAASAPLSAAALELNSVPVIYVGEISDNALYVNPNKNNSEAIFDASSSEFTGHITNLVSGLILAEFSGVSAGIPSVKTGIKGLMDPILCTPDGESQNPDIGAWQYTKPVSEYTEDSIFTDNLKAFVSAASGFISADEIFFFSYDWRLDPLDSADSLRDFIDHVESVTGKRKAAILAVGNGGVVANAYLYEHATHAEKNITSALFYNCSILGNALIGDFMSGKITRTNDYHDSFFDDIKEITGEYRGSAFMTFLSDDATGLIYNIGKNLLGDSAITKLIMRLAVLLGITIGEGQDLHKTIGKAYNKFASTADNVIYDDLLREYLRNMPGLWALVPEKDFDDAIDFLFEDEFINGRLEEKITAYRDVLENTDRTFTQAKQNGINVCVVSNYGYQLLPVTVSLDDISDGIESVKYSSAGAVTTDNSKDPDHLIYCTNDKHSHASADNDINAAYCILPENTWFIKDVPHGDMTKAPVATFLVWLLFGFSQRHVRENHNYTQYMSYSEYSGKLSPYTAPGDEFSETKYGDIDCSGAIESADARLALRISVGLDKANKETEIIADVDGDRAITSADARLILRRAVGLDLSFPVE